VPIAVLGLVLVVRLTRTHRVSSSSSSRIHHGSVVQFTAVAEHRAEAVGVTVDRPLFSSRLAVCGRACLVYNRIVGVYKGTDYPEAFRLLRHFGQHHHTHQHQPGGHGPGARCACVRRRTGPLTVGGVVACALGDWIRDTVNNSGTDDGPGLLAFVIQQMENVGHVVPAGAI
jgi:hypothetical protein